MLVVITIVAVIAGVVITRFDSSARDKLVGAAQVIAADIAHVRNLAVSNNSKYKIIFDRASNSYSIRHSGTNSALDLLPDSAFHSTANAGKSLVTDLSALPMTSGSVDLAWAETSDAYSLGSGDAVTDIEFGPLGETTRSQGTTIWLSAGLKGDRTFIPINIASVTGLASIGTITTSVPYGLSEEESAAEAEAYYDDYYNDMSSDDSYYDETYFDESYYDTSGSSSTDRTSEYEYSELDYSSF